MTRAVGWRGGKFAKDGGGIVGAARSLARLVGAQPRGRQAEEGLDARAEGGEGEPLRLGNVVARRRPAAPPRDMRERAPRPSGRGRRRG